jgi:hypothetical protein
VLVIVRAIALLVVDDAFQFVAVGFADCFGKRC